MSVAGVVTPPNEVYPYGDTNYIKISALVSTLNDGTEGKRTQSMAKMGIQVKKNRNLRVVNDGTDF